MTRPTPRAARRARRPTPDRRRPDRAAASADAGRLEPGASRPSGAGGPARGPPLAAAVALLVMLAASWPSAGCAAGRARRHRRPRRDDLPARARPLPHRQAGRHEGHRVLPRASAPASGRSAGARPSTASRRIPAGAYVKIIGMNNLEEVPTRGRAPHLPPAVATRGRLSVAVAGSAMHFLHRLRADLRRPGRASAPPGGTFDPSSRRNPAAGRRPRSRRQRRRRGRPRRPATRSSSVDGSGRHRRGTTLRTDGRGTQAPGQTVTVVVEPRRQQVELTVERHADLRNDRRRPDDRPPRRRPDSYPPVRSGSSPDRRPSSGRRPRFGTRHRRHRSQALGKFFSPSRHLELRPTRSATPQDDTASEPTPAGSSTTPPTPTSDGAPSLSIVGASPDRRAAWLDDGVAD